MLIQEMYKSIFLNASALEAGFVPSIELKSTVEQCRDIEPERESNNQKSSPQASRNASIKSQDLKSRSRNDEHPNLLPAAKELMPMAEVIWLRARHLH